MKNIAIYKDIEVVKKNIKGINNSNINKNKDGKSPKRFEKNKYFLENWKTGRKKENFSK